ncbi:MAG: hypothetical protein ABIT69_02920 [Sphingomicrobium sp.]
MIFKRFAAGLRAQNWQAIVIELAIVVIGVFIGTWVANWNQERAEQRDIDAIVGKLDTDVTRQLATVDVNHAYYATTNRYAATAFAGWANDPAVSDRDFVIAAYQASQVISFVIGGQTYAMLLGADQVRKIRDEPLRDAIIAMLTFDYEPISRPAVRTRYRDDVRAVIPDSVQTAIRAECGDVTTSRGTVGLPPTCDIPVPATIAAAGARDLRAHPELIGELRQHHAQTSTYLSNVDGLAIRLKTVQAELKRSVR